MHSNLTAADVAKYFGAKVVTKEGTTGAIVGVFSTHQSCNIELQDDVISIGNLISDCHLLLKPLSEISEDDAVEVAKIANFNRVETQLAIGKDIANSIANKIVDSLSSIPYTNIIDIIDYLRKKGYDMDGFLTTNKAKHG
jgi:hypothetical protein